MGAGIAMLVAAGVALAWLFLEGSAETMPDAAPAAFDAEQRREGLHCLEADGSHAQVVQRVKDDLPHPETFRNTGTAIYPLRDDRHFLVMGFRSLAEGGHRTNAAVAMTKIDHEHCFAGEITILD